MSNYSPDSSVMLHSLSAAKREGKGIRGQHVNQELHVNRVGCLRAGDKAEPWDAPKGVQRYTLNDLARATNNFSREHEIGSGGFGKVFYGNFPRNKTLAIKRASTSISANGQTQFRNEVCYNVSPLVWSWPFSKLPLQKTTLCIALVT